MNKNFNKAVALPAVLATSVLAASQANAATITFDQFADDLAGQSGVVFFSHDISESGFTLSDTDPNGGSFGFAALGDQSSSYTGSVALQNGFQDSTTLTQDNGGAFDLNSIDLEKFGTDAETVTFTGLTSTGDTVTQDFLLPGNPDFVLDTYTFSDDFNSVVSASWIFDTDFSYQFDNINVSPVPLPGAVVLFGSGLAGLIGVNAMRRRENRL